MGKGDWVTQTETLRVTVTISKPGSFVQLLGGTMAFLRINHPSLLSKVYARLHSLAPLLTYYSTFYSLNRALTFFLSSATNGAHGSTSLFLDSNLSSTAQNCFRLNHTFKMCLPTSSNHKFVYTLIHYVQYYNVKNQPSVYQHQWTMAHILVQIYIPQAVTMRTCLN